MIPNENMTLPLDILYQNDDVLVIQTHTGVSDKADRLIGHDDNQLALYGKFNMALHVNDMPSWVLNRRARLLAWLYEQAGANQIHWLNQVHGNVVIDVDQTRSQSLSLADALITQRAKTALAIMTADCVPIAIFEKNGSTVACIHAGWQGLANGVIAKTVALMPTSSKLFAVIGACISLPAYEVDQHLAEHIIDEVVTNKLILLDRQVLFDMLIKPSNNCGKAYLDIKSLARLQLEKFGITVLNDTVPCSYLSPKYYSYRLQTHTNRPAIGRMAMLIIKK